MPKIMIVDDDPNIGLLLELTLKKEGYQASKFISGQDALNALEKEKPDLMLLDVMMPGLDGFEVCRQMKASDKTKYISIIIISAKRELKDKIKGMGIGADDYVVKPFNPDELLTRIQVQLRMRKLEIELVEAKKLETALAMAVTLQHEINNPLAGVLGNADLLRSWKEMEEAEVDELIGIIFEQSKRISELIKRMSLATEVEETTYLGKTKMVDFSKTI